MKQEKFLEMTTEFTSDVVTIACYAEAMKSYGVVSKDDKGKETTDYPYKETGSKLSKHCNELFKKGQAYNNAMFKANGQKYTELKFKDHVEFMSGHVSITANWDINEERLASLVLSLKSNARGLSGQRVHFNSGKTWSPSSADTKRGNSILKIVGDIEKLLS